MPDSVSKTADGATAHKIRTSQRYFNPWLLQLYDLTLYNFISPVLWGCSKETLIKRYDSYCRDKHLEVGVGTGYLLYNCQAPIHQLGLMDLSAACLNKTRRRLKHLSPDVWRRNILEPIEGVEEKFQSLSINYVMHCIPGSYTEKGIAFKHLKQFMTDDGILFGASIVKTDQSSVLAAGFMALLNKLGVFNNTQETAEDLEDALRRHFRFVKVEPRSASALFIATDSETSFLRYTTGVI